MPNCLFPGSMVLMLLFQHYGFILPLHETEVEKSNTVGDEMCTFGKRLADAPFFCLLLIRKISLGEWQNALGRATTKSYQEHSKSSRVTFIGDGTSNFCLASPLKRHFCDQFPISWLPSKLLKSNVFWLPFICSHAYSKGHFECWSMVTCKRGGGRVKSFYHRYLGKEEAYNYIL